MKNNGEEFELRVKLPSKDAVLFWKIAEREGLTRRRDVVLHLLATKKRLMDAEDELMKVSIQAR